MNLKEQNSKDRVIIYSTSKFWSVNNKEVFNNTIADIFNVDALTAKKALAYLYKEKAKIESYIAELKTLPLRRNWLGVKKPHAGITKLIALREQITASMTKLNAIYEYDLVIINRSKSRNGTEYGISTYPEFMTKLQNVYKVKEVTEAEFMVKNRLATKEKKIKIYNDIFFFWWFITALSLSVTFEIEIESFLHNYNRVLVVILALAMMGALIKLPPPIMRKLMK